MKLLLSVALCPSGFVTVTLTLPKVWAGVIAVTDELLTTVTLIAAVPPKLTIAPDTKLLPLMVTDVPPIDVPLFGLTVLIVGTIGAV